jgi:hypothetical protein
MSADPGDVDRLYALSREEFLPARDARAKELKAAGDRDAAEEIGKLRKPTVAAWAVNRLARVHAGEIDRLIQAGEELGKLQRKAATGVSRDELRAASGSRRKLIDSLMGMAEEILREAGHPVTRQTLDRIGQTLEAAAVDVRARDLIRRGILDREVVPEAGFGDLAALSVVPAPSAPPKSHGRKGRRAETRIDPTGGAAADRSRQRERERQARLRARADRLAAEADEAEGDARRLRDEAAHAERAAIRARDAAERSEARASQARKRAERAAADASE